MFKGRIKLIGLCAATAASVMLGGCSFGGADYSNIDGYSQAANAQKLYSGLESGHFYIQNNATGERTEEFTFKYREDGQLMYMYMGRESELYLEYHNGSEINRKEGGQEEWSFIAQGDGSYYSYSKENKHPYVTEGVISINAYAVTDSMVEEIEDGSVKISFKYDADAFAGTFEGMGALKSFDSTVWINEDGYCYRLDQKGVFDDNGESVYDYTMFIDQMNEVKKVERLEYEELLA